MRTFKNDASSDNLVYRRYTISKIGGAVLTLRQSAPYSFFVAMSFYKVSKPFSIKISNYYESQYFAEEKYEAIMDFYKGVGR